MAETISTGAGGTRFAFDFLTTEAQGKRGRTAVDRAVLKESGIVQLSKVAVANHLRPSSSDGESLPLPRKVLLVPSQDKTHLYLFLSPRDYSKSPAKDSPVSTVSYTADKHTFAPDVPAADRKTAIDAARSTHTLGRIYYPQTDRGTPNTALPPVAYSIVQPEPSASISCPQLVKTLGWSEGYFSIEEDPDNVAKDLRITAGAVLLLTRTSSEVQKNERNGTQESSNVSNEEDNDESEL